VPIGVTVTPPDVRDRVIAEALRVADERLAAHPPEKDRLEACAAEWLGEVLQSDAYLKVSEVEPATKSSGSIRTRAARVRRSA
jgi:hypothetical protein